MRVDREIRKRGSRYGMTPGNGFAKKGLGRLFAIGELNSRVGQAAIRGPSSTRPYFAFYFVSGGQAGSKLRRFMTNTSQLWGDLIRFAKLSNAFDVPQKWTAVGMCQNQQKTASTSCFRYIFDFSSRAGRRRIRRLFRRRWLNCRRRKRTSGYRLGNLRARLRSAESFT
jgi:hypothetical protein